MKIKLDKIYQSFILLNVLNENNKLSFKIHYWCMRNLNILYDSVKFYENEKSKLYEEYLVKNNDGTYFKLNEQTNTYESEIKEGKEQELNEKLSELNNIDCEIDPYLIDAEYLFTQPDFNLSGKEIFYVDYLFKD